MVKKFLKIAGVKSEADFYKKYPSEAAFFKAHPEAKDLKQYKQGGQMKKLNQLTNWTNDVDNIIPTAQYGCKGKSCTQTGDGIKKHDSRLGLDDTRSGSGGFIDYAAYNAPSTWEELQTYNETNPKDKAFKNQLKTLQGQFPGLTQQQMLAAGADSARIRQRMGDLPRYDKPEEQTYDKAYHMFYRPLMDQSKPVTIPQILQYQSQQPGGLQGYESTVKGNYGRSKAQQGTKLDIWGNPIPITQMDTNPNAGTGQMGLNNPAGGTMTMSGNAGATNLANQTQMWGTGADVTQGGALGGKTPDSIKGIASQKLGVSTGTLTKGLGLVGAGITYAQQRKAEKEARDLANQTSQVTGVQAKAAKSVRQEPIKNINWHPWDNPVQPETLFPSYGGSQYQGNVLAQFGTRIGGNPSEIQNTYNPGNLYSDLGFEPLNDSNQVKRYYHGGGIPQAFGGFFGGTNPTGQAAGQFADAFGSLGEQNAGSGLGKSIGSTAGSLLGPVGGKIGGAIGGLIGGALDRMPGQTKAYEEQSRKNEESILGQQFGNTVHNQFGRVMEDGGYISHDWQPQVISQFDGVPIKSLLTKDPMMDTLRTGGHITQNNMYPQDQFALGGEVKTHWGGYAEPMSYNPYLPASGETIMFRGQSHSESDGKGRTGIGVSFGSTGHDDYTDYAEYGTEAATDKANVEVQRNEPARLGKDGTLVVAGGLAVSKFGAEYAGNPKFAGKKVQTNVKDLSLADNKLNQKKDKNMQIINDHEDYTPIGLLKRNGAWANTIGADMSLKKNADASEKLLGWQNAINEFADENGWDVEKLIKGKYVAKKGDNIGKNGKKIKKAQDGLEYIQNESGTNDIDLKAQPDASLNDIYDSEGNNLTAWHRDPTDIRNWEIYREKGVDSYDDSGEYGKFYINKLTGEKISGKDYKKIQLENNKPWITENTESAINLYNKMYGNVYGKLPELTSLQQTSAINPTASTPASSGGGVDQATLDKLNAMYAKAEKGTSKDVEEFQKAFHDAFPDIAEKIIRSDAHITAKGRKAGYKDSDLKTLPWEKIKTTNEDGIFGNRTKQYKGIIDNYKIPQLDKTLIPLKGTSTTTDDTTQPPLKPVQPTPRNPFMDFTSQIAPWLRPSNQEAFDYAQLYPEIQAKIRNVQQPVQAQQYNPQLLTPYNISLQDQLNEVTAQGRSAERMAGNDPAAAAALLAQVGRMKGGIQGEEFRQNQAQRMGVYNQNINTLNDAQFKNLGILSQQADKQALAKSKTDQQNDEINKSVALKIAQHKLANRTLGVYENMYNYRFDPVTGRAINYNSPYQFDTTLGGSTASTKGGIAPGYEFTYDASGNIIGTRKTATKKEDDAKNGTKLKARNGAIVNALKNL